MRCGFKINEMWVANFKTNLGWVAKNEMWVANLKQLGLPNCVSQLWMFLPTLCQVASNYSHIYENR